MDRKKTLEDLFKDYSGESFKTELIDLDEPVGNERMPMDTFFEQVYEVVARVPFGRVVSYGQIARLLGRPRGARVVGWAMRCCPEELPWHRVVMKDGSITGGVWSELRRARLLEEGVAFTPDGRVDMQKHTFEFEMAETPGLDDQGPPH
jgi:methylated-DNA-protein-cysteine methyltransferase-like protein